MIVDVVAAVRSYLLGVPEVAGLVGTDVYGAELPRGLVDAMPRKVLVLRPSGGVTAGPGVRDYTALMQPRLDVLHYGETPYEALRLERAVRAALGTLDRVVAAQVLLHAAIPAGGPITFRDGETDWPLVVEAWTVLAATVAAA